MHGRISPAEAARRMRKGRDFIMALIKAGELPAIDERRPGSKLPRYTIDPTDLIKWEANRRYVPPAEQQTPRTGRQVVVTGVLARMRESRRMKALNAQSAVRKKRLQKGSP